MSKQIKSSANKINDNSLAGGILFMLKTVLFSYCISVVLLFFVALFSTFNSLSDPIISIIVNTVTAFGVSLCGFLSGRHFESKGLVFGALCGTVYALILWLLGGLIFQTLTLGSGALTAFAIGIICGAVGGIVGINTKKQRRR